MKTIQEFKGFDSPKLREIKKKIDAFNKRNESLLAPIDQVKKAHTIILVKWGTIYGFVGRFLQKGDLIRELVPDNHLKYFTTREKWDEDIINGYENLCDEIEKEVYRIKQQQLKERRNRIDKAKRQKRRARQKARIILNRRVANEREESPSIRMTLEEVATDDFSSYFEHLVTNLESTPTEANDNQEESQRENIEPLERWSTFSATALQYMSSNVSLHNPGVAEDDGGNNSNIEGNEEDHNQW